MPSGEGISHGKFDCAIQELSNKVQGAGALGFSTWDLPPVSFGVLTGMTVFCVAMVMALLKRRDSV